MERMVLRLPAGPSGLHPGSTPAPDPAGDLLRSHWNSLVVLTLQAGDWTRAPFRLAKYAWHWSWMRRLWTRLMSGLPNNALNLTKRNGKRKDGSIISFAFRELTRC